MTPRQMETLRAMHAGEWMSVRHVNEACGMPVSAGASVLVRLKQLGLVEHGWPHLPGLAAAWRLTAKGREVLETKEVSVTTGYILYRGSRDELNQMCRVKDERIAELEAALRSVVQQCDNVIFNTAGGADNDRHLAAWRNVRDFAWRNASKP